MVDNLRPSCANRWTGCPRYARWYLTATIPFETKGVLSAAAIGTDKHMAIEKALQYVSTPVTEGSVYRVFKDGDIEMPFKAAGCSAIGALRLPKREFSLHELDVIWGAVDRHRQGMGVGAVFCTEQKVTTDNITLDDTRLSSRGTADMVVLDAIRQRITVVDWKMGAMPVPAETMQGKIYAMGALGLAGFDVDSVSVDIVQPKAPSGGDTVEYSSAQLMEPVIYACSDGKEEPVRGGWCTFCELASDCPTRYNTIPYAEISADMFCLPGSDKLSGDSFKINVTGEKEARDVD